MTKLTDIPARPLGPWGRALRPSTAGLSNAPPSPTGDWGEDVQRRLDRIARNADYVERVLLDSVEKLGSRDAYGELLALVRELRANRTGAYRRAANVRNLRAPHAPDDLRAGLERARPRRELGWRVTRCESGWVLLRPPDRILVYAAGTTIADLFNDAAHDAGLPRGTIRGDSGIHPERRLRYATAWASAVLDPNDRRPVCWCGDECVLPIGSARRVRVFRQLEAAPLFDWVPCCSKACADAMRAGIEGAST